MQISKHEDLDGYQLINLLGEGGFGVVYRARQESTGQLVAVKMLRLDNTLEEQHRRRQMERFEREAQLCAELNHPHIVKLLDKGRTKDQQLYVVFELVPGESLKDLLLRRGALSAIEAGELMGQVLEALASAHNQGIVHRDLKPHNIMVTTTGTRTHAKVLEMLKAHLQLSEASEPLVAVQCLQAALQQCECKIEWSLPIFCSWLSLPIPENFALIGFPPDRQKQILFEVLNWPGRRQPLSLDCGRSSLGRFHQYGAAPSNRQSGFPSLVFSDHVGAP